MSTLDTTHKHTHTDINVNMLMELATITVANTNNKLEQKLHFSSTTYYSHVLQFPITQETTYSSTGNGIYKHYHSLSLTRLTRVRHFPVLVVRCIVRAAHIRQGQIYYCSPNQTLSCLTHTTLHPEVSTAHVAHSTTLYVT